MNDTPATASPGIEAAALAWHRAINDGSIDWDAFTVWLEAAPDHGAAFDGVALADSLLAEHGHALGPLASAPEAPPAAQPPAPEPLPAPRRRRGWLPLGAGVAASVLVLAAGQLLTHQAPPPAPQIFATAASPRPVALADGTQVLLAPHSRLTARPGALALEGDAVFSVPHRPGRVLSVQVGALTIADIGTRFECSSDPAGVRVAVAEGQLTVHVPGVDGGVAMAAGRAMVYRPASASLEISSRPDAHLSAWQDGALSYQDMPLDLVVADIARYAGQRITVDAALAPRRFSGTLLFGHGHSPAQDLARLMGLAWRPDQAGAVAGAGRLGPGQPG